MLSKIITALWGNLSKQDAKKFGLLACIFYLIIGTYWLLRPFKDMLFLRIVGKSYVAHVKIASAICMVFLVLIYAKLVDWYSREKLTYIICSFYSIAFAIITYFVNSPTMGLANVVPQGSRLLGWVAYIMIESFGTLVIALFWSFVASNVETQEARRGYPIIILGAQLGALCGAFLTTCSNIVSITTMLCGACTAIIVVPFMIHYFSQHYGIKQISEAKKQTGPLEGLRLILAKKYLMGIFAVSTMFETVSIILDIQMKQLASVHYSSPEQILSFFGYFGSVVNLVSLLFAFFGTSLFIRFLGLTKSLTLFPMLVGTAVIYAWQYHSLWGLFTSLVAIKCFAYALNNPCKEIMYIPTSKDVKFKAKSWIDAFGARTAKGLGGFIATFFPIAAQLVLYGSVVSLGIVCAWVPIALYVGRTNRHLVSSNTIIK